MDGNRNAFHLILWLYDRLAGLYPPAFHSQFSAEQREVFLQALEDASGNGAGRMPALRLLAREFADLPGVLARCYLADLRRGGWKSLLSGGALLVLFLIPAVEVIGRIGPVPGTVFGTIFLGGLLLSVIAAVVLGFPRWALPTLGFFLAMASFYLSAEMIDRFMRAMPRRDMSMLPILPRLAYGSVWTALNLLVLLVITFLVFFIPRMINPRRLPRIWRHQRRWSDASFLLYGGVVWLALVALDEYQHNGLVILLEVPVLVLGAYAFLRAPSPWRGVRALLISTVLVFLIIAVGKYFIVPLQGDYWKDWFIAHPVATERWFEALSSLLNLIWLVPVLLVPAWWRPFIERQETG